MQRQSVLKRHAGLVDKMADHVGVDLEEEVLRGRLTADELPEMVLRCTSCSNPDDCAKLLEFATGVAPAPSYCRNAHVFEKLRVGS